jgi:hypothetical protein
MCSSWGGLQITSSNSYHNTEGSVQFCLFFLAIQVYPEYWSPGQVSYKIVYEANMVVGEVVNVSRSHPQPPKYCVPTRSRLAFQPPCIALSCHAAASGCFFGLQQLVCNGFYQSIMPTFFNVWRLIVPVVHSYSNTAGEMQGFPCRGPGVQIGPLT